MVYRTNHTTVQDKPQCRTGQTTMVYRTSHSGIQDKPQWYKGQTTVVYRTNHSDIQDKPQWYTGQTTLPYRTNHSAVQDKPQWYTGQATVVYRTNHNGIKDKPQWYTGQTTVIYRTNHNGIQDKPHYRTGQTTVPYRTNHNGIQDKPQWHTGQTTVPYRTNHNGIQDKPQWYTGQTTMVYRTSHNGTNYPIWALKVGALLRGKKLFKCVISDPEPDIKDEVAWQIWSEKNDEAFGIIVTTLSDEQAGMFLDETKAKKVWDELKKIYTGNLEDKIIDIGLELKNIKMKNNESINEYMARAQNIASQSSSLGHQISQRELAFHIVRGCTTHLSPHLDWMENVMPYESEINLAEEGKVTHATAKGDIKVSTCTENGIENVQIKGVLHVPNLRDGAKIYNEQDDLIAEAQIQDRMYVMETRSRDEYSEKTENVMTTKDDFSNDNISLWHRRLNHLNEAYMKEIIQRNVVLGLNVKIKNLPECEACIMGKLTRQPYHPVTTNCTTKTLELVHMDLCGPMPYQSLGGSKYFFVLVDDFSRRTFVYFLKNKDETLGKFEEFKARVENELNLKIKDEEENDIEIDHRTRPETSELNEETIPTLDEPNEERIVRSGRKKGDTQEVLEEKHRAKLREEEMKLLEQGVRRSQRIKERNNVNFILEPEERIPENYEEAINCENKYEWLEAMKEELYSINKHNVWTLVQREKNMKIINCKWIFSIKSTPGEGVYRRKARLVAIGCNQKYGVEYEESFSPVIRKESLRAIVALAAQLNLVITSYDVKTAYLYGELKETIL
ncbi:hypothetical protein LAZ67_1004695 [Cordylochernes scorpioides]|uniref:Retrovirus-related Pol polyprotein from transposon TNT 1-94 n=1 Tax=Cordylochernes scorpioides TaxID=51811 RepID=A0ABY6JXK8_9ARAC|nr:hypothetical protein LAZ67_1004695 [Cordylochernes scorpioides]